MENQLNGTRSGVPPQLPQPERTAEQLEAIREAMMEELGISRMDTLPLEDKGHQGLIPLVQLVHSQVSRNEAVAAWHSKVFNDVNEADQLLDSIADGQLYRLRRGASAGQSLAPPGRGGHHSSDNTARGGRGDRGGNQARDFLVRGSPVRSGRGAHSGSTRGGRGGSSIDGPHAMTSSSTPSIYFNDARRATNKHSQVDKVIAKLRAAPSQPAQPENRPPASFLIGSLAEPQAFLNAMGMNLRTGNVPAPTPVPSSQPKQAPLADGTTATPLPIQPDFSAIGEASKVIQAMSLTSSQQALPIVGQFPVFARASIPAMAKVGNGLSSSYWATEAAASSSDRPPYSTPSVTITDGPLASTHTVAASTPDAPVSDSAQRLNSSSHASQLKKPPTPTPSEHARTANAYAVEAPAASLKAPERMIASSVLVIEADAQGTANCDTTDTLSDFSGLDVKNSTPAIPRSTPVTPKGMGKPPAAAFDPYSLDTLPVSNVLDIENIATLIDFSQEAPVGISSIPEGGSALDDLVCMKNDFMVASVLEMLNRAAGGPFLKANQDMSIRELLSLVEDLTIAWLKCSNSFRKFPPLEALAYANEIAKQVFDGACAADLDFQTQNMGKYSIQELVGLRNRAQTIRHKLPQPPLSTPPPPASTRQLKSLQIEAPFQPPAAPEFGQRGSDSLSDQKSKILETSNNKDDMERANVPGLAKSKWSSKSS